MSFVDGLRNKCAIIHVSPHNDIADMESNIIKHGPGIIIVDALYSNNGSFAPITEILRLKRTYDCIVVVDESHSLGVYGRHGYLHMMGLEKEIDYITASLAKAFCTRAGLIIGGNATFIKENSWSYIFSSALTDNDIVRLRSMFEVIKNADDRRERLMAASHALREGLARITNVTLTDIPSPIICLDMDSDEKAAHLNRLNITFIKHGN
ncbi:hypothetical protein BGW41_007482 [Actinomortierella wolfii]|nr:hypothetical protein BGW41_007482 [Actinomortierella wolfii]